MTSIYTGPQEAEIPIATPGMGEARRLITSCLNAKWSDTELDLGLVTVVLAFWLGFCLGTNFALRPYDDHWD